MKKFICIILSIFSLAIVLTACEKSLNAETSDNIRYVSAAYHVADELNEAESRLQKNAEVKYSNMYITPAENFTATGLSFDAKLKSGNENQTIKVRAYLLDNYTSTESRSDAGKKLLGETEVVLTGQEGTVSLTFSEGVELKAAAEMAETKSGVVQVDFIYGDFLNKSVIFTINNVKLIAE